MALPAAYFEDGTYDKWSRVVWTIHNIAVTGKYEQDGRVLAHDFSRQGSGYDAVALDKLWDNARIYGRLRHWGSLARELRVSGVDAETIRALCATVVRPEAAPVDTIALQARLLDVCPDLQQPVTFTFGHGHVAFVDSAGKRGTIDAASGAVSVDGSNEDVYLVNDVPVPSSLSICHTAIPDDMRFRVNFEGSELATLLHDHPPSGAGAGGSAGGSIGGASADAGRRSGAIIRRASELRRDSLLAPLLGLPRLLLVVLLLANLLDLAALNPLAPERLLGVLLQSTLAFYFGLDRVHALARSSGPTSNTSVSREDSTRLWGNGMAELVVCIAFHDTRDNRCYGTVTARSEFTHL
jgi:hypothetical protein